MKVEIKEKEEWFKIANELGKATVNCDPDFIEIISNVFAVEPYCAIIYAQEIPILGILAYYKKKSIVHPSTYFYTAVWSNSNSSLKLQEAFISYISFLKLRFRFMEFLLPPDITDVRPFIYTGFKPSVKYTYINNLLETKINSDEKSLKNKSDRIGVTYKWEDNNIDVLQQHLRSFSQLGYSRSFVKKMELLCSKLLEKNFLKALSARLNDNLLASSFTLIDNYQSKSFNLLVTSLKTHYNIGVHAGLYIKNFENLRNLGIKEIDLFGATTKGIGNFKSNFGGELKPYYYVKYNFLRWQIVKIWNFLKLPLFKILNK